MSTSIFKNDEKNFVPLCEALRAFGAQPQSSRLRENVEYTTKDGESFTTNVLCFITDRPFTTVQNGKKVVSNKVVNVSFSKKLTEETNSAITKEWFKQNYKSVNCTLADGKTDWLVICAQGEFNDELADCEW